MAGDARIISLFEERPCLRRYPVFCIHIHRPELEYGKTTFELPDAPHLTEDDRPLTVDLDGNRDQIKREIAL